MNLYFLVEGKQTERKVYPKWLSVLAPQFTQVKYAGDAVDNNFYLVSGEGYPSLLHHLRNAIKEVNSIGRYDYLVVCLDAEENSVDERMAMIAEYQATEGLQLEHGRLVVIVQNPCFETWFLGNRKVFKRNPQDEELKKYIDFYNVQTDDPELMPAMREEQTRAQFHHSYLKKILAERNAVYTKQKPDAVCDKTFLDELIYRNEETGHMTSFRNFIDFCYYLNAKG